MSYDQTTADLLRENAEFRSQLDAVTRRHDANVAGIMEAVCDLIAADVVPKGSKSLGDAVKGALTALSEARHRAERMELAIRAVRDAYNEQRSDSEKDAAWVALIQSLDATPTRETP